MHISAEIKRFLKNLIEDKSEKVEVLRAEQEMIIFKARNFLDPSNERNLGEQLLNRKIIAVKTDQGVSLSLEFEKYRFKLEVERFQHSHKVFFIPKNFVINSKL